MGPEDLGDYVVVIYLLLHKRQQVFDVVADSLRLHHGLGLQLILLQEQPHNTPKDLVRQCRHIHRRELAQHVQRLLHRQPALRENGRGTGLAGSPKVGAGAAIATLPARDTRISHQSVEGESDNRGAGYPGARRGGSRWSEPWGGGGVAGKAASVPVGTSGCTHRFEFSGINCLCCLSQVPSHGGNAFLVRESGTVVPLLTSAASAPRRPSLAGAGNASHSAIPKTVTFGGCSPPPMWAM